MDDTRPGRGDGELLGELPFRAHIEHAYTPRETATHGGGDHLVVEQEVRIGRILRSAGDALCRPRRRFWGLARGGEDRVPSCRRCVAVAGRAIAAPGSVRTGAAERSPGDRP
ncbi:MAG TPA: hypothetical protein VHA80_05520 [Solirubrobacterales bacterium]|nr:hypothetical protein [Solirubrobacterales bacterium]